VTGDVDFILVVSVVDMTEYEELTKRLFFANSNIKKFRTYVAMERVKMSLELPIA
jgi:DNA-binding Lrp family transcriptional regulator